MAAPKKVKGDRALLQRIATIQAGVGALVSRERLGTFLVRRMKDRFDREVDPDGNRWKGRAPSTRGGHNLLNRTGRLRGAIGVLGGAGGDNAILAMPFSRSSAIRRLITRVNSSSGFPTPSF